jgi:hypothetical protein
VPVKKVKGGYKHGKSGKVYRSRREAEKQGAAIRHSQKRRGRKTCPK